MVLAIANRQNLADQPHMQDEDDDTPTGGPLAPGGGAMRIGGR